EGHRSLADKVAISLDSGARLTRLNLHLISNRTFSPALRLLSVGRGAPKSKHAKQDRAENGEKSLRHVGTFPKNISSRQHSSQIRNFSGTFTKPCRLVRIKSRGISVAQTTSPLGIHEINERIQALGESITVMLCAG